MFKVTNDNREFSAFDESSIGYGVIKFALYQINFKN